MVTSLLYISRSRIHPADVDVVVKRIVAESIVANSKRSLTGALLFTGTHFAQIIEGQIDDIDILMGKLGRDHRHDRLQIVERHELTRRRFHGWSMAYFGPSQFVARHVTRLLHDRSPAEHHRAAGWLTELLEEFAGTTATAV